MQQWDVHAVGDHVGDLVHRVGTKHDEVGARIFEIRCNFRELACGVVPARLGLHALDGVEVDREHQALCRMQPATQAAHALVDDPIILRRRFPAHAPNQSDGLHDLPLPSPRSGSTRGSRAPKAAHFGGGRLASSTLRRAASSSRGAVRAHRPPFRVQLRELRRSPANVFLTSTESIRPRS